MTPKFKYDTYSKLCFDDFPDFKPNLTPREIFMTGSFGGTYWREIKSAVTGKKYKNIHKKYPKSWWKGIASKNMTTSWDNYDKNINTYGVKVGSTLEFWEEKNWINTSHPYGWIHWYCDFCIGKRGSNDIKQINRWLSFTGPKGRFRNQLINLIYKKKTKFDDFTVSPKIRQSLQHWGYRLTKKDYKEYIDNKY